MDREKNLRKRLDRLTSWADRVVRIFDKSVKQSEDQYFLLLKELDEEKKQTEEKFKIEEDALQSKIDQAGVDYSKAKYVNEQQEKNLETDIHHLKKDTDVSKQEFDNEVRRLNEEKVKSHASFERQRSALQELYQEKRRHLTGTKAKIIHELQIAEENLKKAKDKSKKEMDQLKTKNGKTIKEKEEQYQAKKEGWTLALETVKKQIEGLKIEKEDLHKKLISIREENEKQLEAIRTGMVVAQEQLEVDKATLIEKAETEKKATEKEIQEITRNLEKAEKDLQTLILDKEKRTKNEEEEFEQEEKALQAAVKNESEKRDYEQKLFQQEKNDKEKEINRLKEEHEKKKWYWDSQIRNLMMKKSVQEAEFEAEKMRVDREARVALKSLESKRDELKQTLAGLKSRYDAVKANDQKEGELRQQRWRWRKDRLWAMWQNRLALLKKERKVLQEQVDAFHESFLGKKKEVTEEGAHQEGRIDDIQQLVLHLSDRNQGYKKQHEIQLELEKTRLLAQIKEGETLIEDWKGRLKGVQDELTSQNSTFSSQLSFFERFYKEEEQETEAFLRDLKNILSLIESKLNHLSISEDAA